ncbi:MAG: hypothetical protein QOG30_1547 [Acidimicrobiaceae bacterium]|jgi:hypothetical protein
MVKRILLAFAALALGGMFVLMDAAPSGATVTPSDKCIGTGHFVKSGHDYTANDAGVDEIPRVDDVQWAGEIVVPATESPYSGEIKVSLPPPFGDVKVDDWSGSTDSTKNSGDKHYDIPGFVPANVEFEVSGFHTQSGVTCTGAVKIKIAGSGFGPFSIATLILTLLSGAGLVLAGLQGNYAGG